MKLPRLLSTILVTGLVSSSSLMALTVADITDVTPKVDESPVPVRTTSPDYPADLKKSNTEGVVAVLVVVDETGAVLACEISKSTNEGFNDSALKAVQKWKFKPAKLAGKAVKVKVTIPIRFTAES